MAVKSRIGKDGQRVKGKRSEIRGQRSAATAAERSKAGEDTAHFIDWETAKKQLRAGIS